jgi:hypothetical protein
VDDTVPCVASIVDNDVDLAVAELSCLLDKRLDVSVVEDVAADCDRLAAILLDAVDYRLCLLWAVLALILPQHSADILASTSATTTLAPSFANSLAASAPIPCPDPVMIAT